MSDILLHDQGAAVEDVQRRLNMLGYLDADSIDGKFEDKTESALKAFCRDQDLKYKGVVDDKLWARLVDESFELGDRVLYLRLPFFHGRDVRIIQTALSALGFSTGKLDGIFGPHTEEGLRKFQVNLGLPTDGIAGALTYRAIMNLRHSWEGNDSLSPIPHFGFARAAEVLEKRLICLYGTNDFTRSVASRISNLALATTPSSKLMSADSLLVSPDLDIRFIEIIVGNESPAERMPIIDYDPPETLSLRLEQSLITHLQKRDSRIALRLPDESWQDAGQARSAQHYAIIILDALCAAFASLDSQG